MIAQGDGGRIINITSVHEDWPMPGNTPYCLSKGGMRMLTRTAGVELGPHGVLVVGVGPGAVDTPINASTEADPAKMKILDAAIPIGRLAEPERDRRRRRLPRRRRRQLPDRHHDLRRRRDHALEPRAVILAVNPVPWARSQMAFTLAFHIVLVPLGVSWAFFTLIANYKALRHDDAAALRLAQRWSKFMAVTFAVGAVTGTVLSFEFGLLWPHFMGQWGAAFGVPFAFEGLFFFTEAIFVAIYIYGWRRLKPWAHFWTGVPIVVAGIGGSVSVVAANAWMNEPAGLHLNSAGKIVSVDPWGVIFNKAMPLMSAHMVVAAYVVGGLPDRLGLRRRPAARPRRPLPPARLHDPVLGGGRRHLRPDGRGGFVGPLGLQQPAGQVRGHRAGAPDHRATCPRRCSATSTATAR